MEDRYLFKGKRIDNGEWVQGYLFDDGFENGRMFVGGLVIEEYHGTACDDWSITGINFCEVDPSTICQCTGLKDRNGKLIWENDIVELYDRNTDYKWRAVVLFGNPNCEYTWGWQLKPIVECETNTDILCWIDMEESGAFCEVIGNIFDEGSENIGKGAEEN